MGGNAILEDRVGDDTDEGWETVGGLPCVQVPGNGGQEIEEGIR
jgi:hypothetical protein